VAKKSRRTRKQRKAPRLTDAQLVSPQDAARPSDQEVVAKAALEEEYRYVVSDLRRIAIIAAIMLAVMIILAVVMI